jgi:hypothetical protein
VIAVPPIGTACGYSSAIQVPATATVIAGSKDASGVIARTIAIPAPPAIISITMASVSVPSTGATIG